MSNFITEPESKEYDACQFELNNKKVVYRSSKITPKKVGQFVTCWKRTQDGITAPYSELDAIDFLVISVKTEVNFGQFIFPKSELIRQGILSTNLKDGKRGFRLYPSWDKAHNNQAKKTQHWQLNYFFEMTQTIDLKKVEELFNER